MTSEEFADLCAKYPAPWLVASPPNARPPVMMDVLSESGQVIAQFMSNDTHNGGLWTLIVELRNRAHQRDGRAFVREWIEAQRATWPLILAEQLRQHGNRLTLPDRPAVWLTPSEAAPTKPRE